MLGAGGAGKTTLVIPLPRELLREPREGEPVPVPLSLAGWDTDRHPTLRAWLGWKLTEIYRESIEDVSGSVKLLPLR